MKKILSSVTSLVVLSAMFVGCSSGPNHNAQKFLDGFYHMDYEAAKSVSTEDTKKELSNFESMIEKHKEEYRNAMKNIKVKIKDTKADGDFATVTYIINDDPESKNTLSMVREKGEWHAKWNIISGMNSNNTTVLPEGETDPAAAVPLDTTLNIPADGAENRPPSRDSSHR